MPSDAENLLERCREIRDWCSKVRERSKVTIVTTRQLYRNFQRARDHYESLNHSTRGTHSGESILDPGRE